MGTSARTIAGLVRSGEVTAREVVAAALERADAARGIGALWHVDARGATAAAARVDRVRAAGGDPGPLAGVPVVVKDAFAVRGMPGDGGSGIVAVATRDAAAVARVRRAGAVVLGKAAMHQLAWGTSGQTPGRPRVENPVALGQQPGGSSSGSAAAVAAGIVPVALGSDTAGSVRLPAAWCGVVGIKPRQAAVPRRGLLPLAPSFDTVGVLAAGVDDGELLMDVLRGRPVPRADVNGVHVMLDAEALAASDAAVAQACARAAQALAEAGAVVSERPAGLPAPRVGTLYAAEFADAWAHRLDVDAPHLGDDVRAGLRAGLEVRATAYLRAQRELAAARRAAREYPAVVAWPASPMGPPPLDAPDDVRRATALTRPFNALDWSAVVVPLPDVRGAALQLAAPPGRENALRELAAVAEAAAVRERPRVAVPA